MIIFIIITLLLDIVLKYLYPSLGILFLTSSLVLIYMIYPIKKTYLFAIIFGIIYDLLYTDIGFINIYLNIIIIFCLKNIFSKLEINNFTVAISTAISLIVYLLVIYIVLLLSSRINLDSISFIFMALTILINVLYNLIAFEIINTKYILRRQ